MKSVLDRFLSYIDINTMSRDEVTNVPSTNNQFVIAKALVQELHEMGAQNIYLDETHCYVYASIPATVTNKPVFGLIAHMDTSPAMSGANIKRKIIKAYDGEDILLNKKENIVLSRTQFPILEKSIGKDIIVTDGTTLLGADDKAGIAEIMTAAEYLLLHTEIPHGEIRIGFTPDEEVGRGVDFFDVKRFAAEYAYTVDGGCLGELEYDNFNAASGKISINGTSIHTGSAKNIMLNALHVGMEFHHMLPTFQDPSNTEGYEGFFHLDCFEGNIEHAKMSYIIRDHDQEKFNEKKERLKKIAAYLNDKYGDNTVELELKDSYYNMKKMIVPHMFIVDNVEKAMLALDIPPQIIPIRGGTDGARLSFMGLPCPNICTGGNNFHGKYEYIPVQDMEKVVALLIKIAEMS